MRMGPRMSKGRTEPRIGPMPFSTEWIDDPPPPTRPRRVPVGQGWLPASLPGWLPSERLLSAFLVLVIILGTAAFSSGSPASRELSAPDPAGAVSADTGIITESGGVATGDPVGQPGVGAAVAASTETSSQAGANTGIGRAIGSASGTDGTGTGVAADAAAVAGDEQSVASAPLDQDASANLLPDSRIVAFYGHPHEGAMGILGTTTIQDLYDQIMVKVADWEEADPSRPVIPAFEIITSVAQADPQADGSFLSDTDFETIQEYIDFAADHDMLVFLDTQIGRRSIPDEIDRLRPLLEQPNVHLALDPEFAMDEGEVPSIDLGEIDASDVNDAQRQMADLSAELGIPQKLLLVHQFHYSMIENKENVEDVPGVELIIHADGHGAPEEKQTTYAVMVTEWIDQITFFSGFKVFMDNNEVNDTPEMTPADMMALDPPPDIITYQ